MHVIGTAGHVDHGKSTLIEALTGMNPDRLKEEQERSMTIDLGFAWLTLPGGEEVGIVDVPGHRDFIENMLAGVGGIDAALLVIAADEGVMPQTREHLAILDLLQLSSGIVALTKTDLVEDEEWLGLMEADIRAALLGTALEAAPILRVSSVTRQGLPGLLQAMQALVENLPAHIEHGRPRLPVDRVFTMPGFGTVVTGTLADGAFNVGDEVEILPSGERARIRGLQTHKKKEEKAVAGSRTAINLSGIDVGRIARGDVVTLPSQYHASRRLDTHFRLLPGVSAPLAHHTEVKLFLGTAEVIADVRLLGVESLKPGETGWLQLELRHPILAARADKYILRRPSPSETLGGGVVVDPLPQERHKRFDQAVLEKLGSLLRGTPEELILQASLELGPALLKDVLARARIDPENAAEPLGSLFSTNQLVLLEQGSQSPESIVIAAARWAALKELVLTALTEYHRAYPLRRGMPREELRSRLKLPPRAFNEILHRFGREGALVEGDKWAALPEHKVKFSPFQQVKVDHLMKRFEASPFSPPSAKECQAEVGEEIFGTMLENGDLVAVSTEVVFRAADYESMVEKVRQFIRQNGRISLAEARDLFNTSRRYVQALLEHLDSRGITLREGDFRRLKQQGN